MHAALCCVPRRRQVAFDHWRGEAVGRDDPSARFVVEGVDMLLFNEEGQITVLVQFDQQVRRACCVLAPR